MILHESDIVNAVSKHLTDTGWTVTQALMPTAKGDDIVATRNGLELRIEAKGAGKVIAPQPSVTILSPDRQLTAAKQPPRPLSHTIRNNPLVPQLPHLISQDFID